MGVTLVGGRHSLSLQLRHNRERHNAGLQRRAHHERGGPRADRSALKPLMPGHRLYAGVSYRNLLVLKAGARCRLHAAARHQRSARSRASASRRGRKAAHRADGRGPAGFSPPPRESEARGCGQEARECHLAVGPGSCACHARLPGIVWPPGSHDLSRGPAQGHRRLCRAGGHQCSRRYRNHRYQL